MLTVTGVSVLNHASASKLAFRRRARAKVSAFSSRRAVMSALQRTNRGISAGRIGLLKHVLTGRRCITTEQQILLLLKRQMEFLRQCLSRTLLIMDTNRTWTTLMHNNEFYVCRVCGAEQLDPPGGKMVKYQVMTYVTVVVLSLGMKI